MTKTHVSGGDVQLALHDGATLVVEDASEYSGKDSIVVDNETKDVVAHFPYEEGALVTAVDGPTRAKSAKSRRFMSRPAAGTT